MQGADVVRQTRIDEVIHRNRRADLVVQSLRLAGSDDAPPLAIERTVAPDGPVHPAPVVLVHGLAQNRYTWRVTGRSMSGHLAQAGYEVLNLELRGHGHSRGYGAGNARSFTEYIDDLARVAEACRRPPFVIGHSLGGAVALGAATRVPLAGVIHLAGVWAFARRNRTLRALARLTLGFEPLLLASPARLSTGWAGGLLSRLYGVTDFAGYGAPIAGWTPDSIERELLEERLERGFDWTSVEVWLQMARWALGEQPSWADPFLQLDIPLFVMVGDRDPLVQPGDVEALVDRSQSSDLTYLLLEPWEHQVHWGHIDLILGQKAPEETWPRIVAWLRARS